MSRRDVKIVYKVLKTPLLMWWFISIAGGVWQNYLYILKAIGFPVVYYDHDSATDTDS